MRLLLVLIVAVALAGGGYALASHEAGYEPAELYPHGGVHGGDAYVIPLGDIQGVRNIQGGRHTGLRSDLNLDIGAGSTQHPGQVAINYDVGRCTVIFNGKRHRIARFCPDRIDFYVPVHRR